jgi:hypothetical protein
MADKTHNWREKAIYLPVPHPKASHVFGYTHIITDFSELKFGW